MAGRQRILPARRAYNRWVADQTLEDYALRFTAKSARRWSAPRVAQTALGAISFLALEAVGGAITLSYGFANAALAALVVGVVLFLTGLPISRHAARHGVDIDLLTRGAGFGYIGSTVTSLVYAAFTFILFAIEASIMSAALELCFGVPPWLGYIVSAAAVIPLATHGITWISRFQLLTQPLWIGLNVLPIGFILWKDPGAVGAWTRFAGLDGGATLTLAGFGGAASVILGLMPQIGEQVDVLRFLPAGVAGRARATPLGQRLALLVAGPGWVLLGIPKLLFGSFLAVLATRWGVPESHAGEPAWMYRLAFSFALPSPQLVLGLTAAFVVVSQLKINVMNAYAGSLAWSNFFSRLTHSHPGRVVWLVFNVAIALLLMELGIYAALERTLGLFSIVAVAWLGAITGDLAINKPLGLSPPGIEFKRAHLYDINPVGVGAMGIAAALALVAQAGLLGPVPAALSPFVALGTALAATPLLAWATGGRFYLARKPRAGWRTRTGLACTVCDNPFEPEDMAWCPAYAGAICSLCCSLDRRCRDLCKPAARLDAQAMALLGALAPAGLSARLSPRALRYGGLLALFVGVISLVLLLVRVQVGQQVGARAGTPLDAALLAAFFLLLIVAGIAAWFFVLAQESRRLAEEESSRQTTLLLREIEAHRRTDAALEAANGALQRAKEAAEAANLAKSRYVVGLGHELRTPLNAVLGHAQILEGDEAMPPARRPGVRTIRRSAEHLSGLIDGLLDISRIEAGRLEIASAELALPEFLDGIADLFRPQAEAKGLAFHYAAQGALPTAVRTDEKRLRQVLINLLSNAVKFTAAGEVALTARYRNDLATLVVEDTGPGIGAADLDRVFEPFERGSQVETGAGAVPGLGLGLTITRLLVGVMGGDLGVESRPGAGSRFTVRLRLPAVARSRPAPARRPTGYAGPRRTVLVADDNPDHGELMREALAPLGFAVLAARDGPACLAMVEAVRPDLFLLDVSMPGMDGWALARALRLRGQAAPILMVSATIGANLGGPDRAKPATEPDHDGVLAKPVDLARLLDRIGALLGLDWTEAPAAPLQAAPAIQMRVEALAGVPPDMTPDLPPSLPAGALADLRRLARLGHVRGLEARLAELARNASPALRADLTGVAEPLARFDLGACRRAIEVLAARETAQEKTSQGAITVASGSADG